MPYISNKGYRTYYYSKGQGKPIVFIHGYLGSAKSHWGDQIFNPSLQAQFQLIAPDLRGFGRSNTKIVESHPTSKIIQDLRILITQELQLIDKPILVGYSVGAGLILKYTLLWPEDVKGLLLLSPRPFIGETTRAWSPLSKEKRSGKKKSSFSSKIWTIVKILQNQMTLFDTKIQLRRSKDYLTKISEIQQPILLLYGNRDTVNPRLSFNVLRDFLPPHAKIGVFPADHGISHEHPRAFNKVLTEFCHSTFS